MSSTADPIDEARPFLAALVKREQQRAGSRMLAYDAVARKTGMSSSWVRKVLAGQFRPDIKVRPFRRIAAAYVELCERFEAEAEKERQLRAVLLERANEALAGTLGVVPGQERTTSGAKEDE